MKIKNVTFKNRRNFTLTTRNFFLLFEIKTKTNTYLNCLKTHICHNLRD